MKLVVISDTHENHEAIPSIPMGDVLIHCGDFTNFGGKKEIDQFVDWFNNQPHEHKICIAGNHERTLCPILNTKELNIDFKGIHYLQDSSIVIDDVIFYGTPWIGGEERLMDKWGFFNEGKLNSIPDNVDVLITHSPPYNILDKAGNSNLGSRVLSNRLKKMVIKPIVHFFGHIHDSYGKYMTDYTTYYNCSSMNKNYEISNPPTIFTI
jgi:Icc-related predicted phosphoesterase